MPAPPPPLEIKALSAVGGDKEEQKRIHSNMMILNGNTGGEKNGANGKNGESSAASNDPNSIFEAKVLASSRTEKTLAARLDNLGITIAQGKIIDAVIETAINTDLPGTVRAIVSRDVYAESGRSVMIPKGSRLLGTYNTSINRGQGRVLIVWTRLIRPDGIDIQIGSAAIDPLGRAGVAGITDNKYAEIFSAAFITSVLDIGVAVMVDKLTNQNSTTTTNSNGTTSTGSAAAPAGASAVSNIAGISKDIINTVLDLRPTITIDQGTRINVFVNKDLIFPGSTGGKAFIE